jgi:hypothetical protein
MKIFLSLVAFLVCTNVFALPRDHAQKSAFRKENPCPSTGENKGACPGYEIDHKKALMNRGKDKPKNMQWLSKHEHKKKTKHDIAKCKDSYFCKSKRHKKKLFR